LAGVKVALVAALALVLAAGATAAGPSVKVTSAGTADAKASLLTLTDLGKGWTGKATAASAPILSCTGYTPSFTGVVETGVASSPTFAASTSGPFLVEQTSVFASAGQASKVWQRAVRPGLLGCAAQTLGTLAAKGIHVTIVARQPLQLAKPTPHTAAYRVVGKLKTTKQTLTAYLDVVYVSRGASLTAITFSSFVKPVPTAVEVAIAKLVAHRMGANTA
jgi:hypothetical protein